MNFISLRSSTWVAALALAFPLAAQTTKEPSAPPVAVDVAGQAMADALKFRGETADAVSTGATSSEEAISRLKAQEKATGLEIDADADFAYAAIDIGRRLVVSKPAAAEKLFQAAEESLDVLVQRTTDDSAKYKAQLLCQLAFIRCEFLDEAVQARKDIDQAIALQPKDPYLQQARSVMANSHAEQFRIVTGEGKP